MLNWFQHLFLPPDQFQIAPWMLKQVQHDDDGAGVRWR